MHTEKTPILQDSQYYYKKRKNNEVEFMVVRFGSFPRLTVLVVTVGFLGCLVVFGFLSLHSRNHSAVETLASQISATSEEGQETNGAIDSGKELTLQDVYDLAKRVGSPRLPETELKRLQDSDEICTTKGCLEAASSLLSSMNFSVNPCEDFYQFTCGQWIADNQIPESQSRWNQFNIMRNQVNDATIEILSSPKNSTDALPVNQVKDFYKLCADTGKLEKDGLSPIREILKSYGDWPLLLSEGDWSSSSFNWLHFVADTTRRFQLSVLIIVTVEQDWKSTDNNIIYIDQPSLMLPRTMLVDDNHNYGDVLAAYRTYIEQVGRTFTKYQQDEEDLDPESDVIQRIRADAAAVVEFEQQLANITSKNEERANNDRMYNKRTLAEYQEETKTIGGEYEPLEWKQLLDTAFSSSGVFVDSNEPVIMPELNYIDELTTLLGATPIRTVANYLHFRLVDSLLSETTQEMRDIQFKFKQMLTGALKPKSRPETCADDANASLGMAIGVKYVEKEFDDTAKSTVNKMLEDVRVEYNGILEGLGKVGGWMDASTSEKAQEKLKVMKSFMAYPDWLQNKSRVEAFYAGLDIGYTNHLTNVERILTWSSDDTLKKLRMPVDREFWLAPPVVVNAFYNPTTNSITFPSGILQPPFFKNDYPGFLNYGSIGAVIGHEMTHGFDNSGRQFDEYGNLNNWWTESTLTNFQERTKCIANQYDAFKPNGVELHVNGNLTQGENIADNGGVHESFLAYQRRVRNGLEDKKLPGLEQYDGEQLFFLGFARTWCENITPEELENQILVDPHSPSRFRVQGPLSNSEQFAQNWECVAGTAMNPSPSSRCVLW